MKIFKALSVFIDAKIVRVILDSLVIFSFVFFAGFFLWDFEARDWLLETFISFSWYQVCACLGFFLTGVYVLYRVLSYLVRHYGKRYSLTFRKKIAFVLGGIAVVPILSLSIVMLFLYASMQAWFDDRVANTVEKAVSISEIYLKEHKSRLSGTVTQIVRDIESRYSGVLASESSGSDFLNKGVDSGLFDEALVFKINPTFVLAKTTLSFFSLNDLPQGLLTKIAPGSSVEIYSDIYGVQVLSRFLHYEDTYLIVIKSIDKSIVEYLHQTHGAVASYEKLQKTISALKWRFSLALFVVAIFLLVGAIYAILIFSEKITKPLQDLVQATAMVEKGDFNAQVSVAVEKDEISILGRAFNKMVTRLKRQRSELLVAQKSLAWSEVARRVAHEINNPLTPIKLSAEILQSRFGSKVSKTDDFKKYTQNIIEYVNDIQGIVSSFVYFAKLPQPIFKKCFIAEWLNSAIDVRRNTNDKVFYIFKNLSSPDFFIECDIGQISQMINNLFTNAEEALGDIVLNGRIDVVLDGLSDRCKITISDNGPGFALDIISKATEPYVSTKARSSGLGLAIVEKIVRDHNGTLEFANKKEGGAIISIDLPQKQFDTDIVS